MKSAFKKFSSNHNQRFKFNKTVIIMLFSLCLPACQLTEQYFDNSIASNTVNYGQYYLALKNLSESELRDEIIQQELKKSQGSIEAEINLILLRSLPNSPGHNAYAAKSKLNEQLKLHNSYHFNSADQAFISLLKDQLNQQLYLFQKLINQELAYDTQAAKHRIKDKKQKNKIAALELTVSQLTKQITQLKKIEQTISGHGQ